MNDTLVTTILRLDRLDNVQGNPRYRLVTTDGSFTTEHRSAVGYVVSPSLVGRRVFLTFNGPRVVDIEN